MIVYALRHKATGKFMPSRMYRTSLAGFSFWNPHETRPGWLPHDQNPRIFFTRQSAKNAKVMWEAGEWRKRFGPVDCSMPFGPEEFVGVAPDAPEIPRAKGDLEIVVMTLRERTTP